jgi:excisionase family DNA binding protein
VSARRKTEGVDSIEPLRPAVMTREEAARYLSIGITTLDRLRFEGKIGCVIVGGGDKRPRVRFPVRELDDFLERACTKNTISFRSETPPDGTSSGLSEVDRAALQHALRTANAPRRS